MLKCALSGIPLQNPVLSKLTGHVFEKDLIETHIDKTGQCPISGTQLTKDDLIEIKSSKFIKPREEGSSMNGILHKLQSEYDNITLDKFRIKKQLEDAKSELAHTLYQHEAASLVICRLIKERDEVVDQLNILKAQVEQIQGEEIDAGEEFDYMGIYKELSDRINESTALLSGQRKERKIPEDYPSVKDLKRFKLLGEFPIHSSSKPGINCLDTTEDLIATGGIDAKANLFNVEQQKIVNTIDGHTKKINSIELYPTSDLTGLVISSADNTATFWTMSDTTFTEKYRILNHTNQITKSSIHPLKEYVLICSKDASWSFHNLFKGVCITKQKLENEINTCSFHPDGRIFGCGENNGILSIHDLIDQKNIFNFEAHANVNSIAFSENGYFLASSGVKESEIKIWDLRKTKLYKKIVLPSNKEARSITFDHSGQYLAIAGSSIWIYSMKDFKLITEFTNHTDIVTDVKFDKGLRYFATTSMDRNLNIYNKH
jgi:pre-mRNA-processing factor 19